MLNSSENVLYAVLYKHADRNMEMWGDAFVYDTEPLDGTLLLAYQGTS